MKQGFYVAPWVKVVPRVAAFLASFAATIAGVVLKWTLIAVAVGLFLRVVLAVAL